MESLKKILTILIFVNISWAQETIVSVKYFSAFLGHVHQSPSRTSPSLTTIQCGHPIKIVKDASIEVSDDWARVAVADYKGFIWNKHLVTSKPDCFQGRYPKFVDSFNLDLTELYYWGRLHDHWEEGVVE
jgi:hypothetical protein